MRVFGSKSYLIARHYTHMASFRFKIIFDNSPLPTHREFSIKNQIQKLVTTQSRRVFDSKSYLITRHYPHMASFWFKIKFENSSLPTSAWHRWPLAAAGRGPRPAVNSAGCGRFVSVPAGHGRVGTWLSSRLRPVAASVGLSVPKAG
jgi:hypothetical protein